MTPLETNLAAAVVINRSWPQSKRDKTPHKDFAGPHESFPIETQADVDAAAHLIGKADDPDAVKARIKAIAKKKGLTTPWDDEAEPSQNQLTEVTCNLTGRVRQEKLNGRSYLVAPVSMLVPGVLNGSKGPLLYPQDEVVRNHDDWNGMPIVVRHPFHKNKPISARNPLVYDKQVIGTVFNTGNEGKLTAEGWFDEDLTKRVDVRIYNRLKANQPIELSTGLFTDNIAAPKGATFNGKPYSFIAKNYKPDHLAVLPDEVGACSLKDGCGVLINSDGTVETIDSTLNAKPGEACPHCGAMHERGDNGKCNRCGENWPLTANHQESRRDSFLTEFWNWLTNNGGSGSGNFGHAGRPGEQGGSSSGSGGSATHGAAKHGADHGKAERLTKRIGDTIISHDADGGNLKLEAAPGTATAHKLDFSARSSVTGMDAKEHAAAKVQAKELSDKARTESNHASTLHRGEPAAAAEAHKIAATAHQQAADAHTKLGGMQNDEKAAYHRVSAQEHSQAAAAIKSETNTPLAPMVDIGKAGGNAKNDSIKSIQERGLVDKSKGGSKLDPAKIAASFKAASDLNKLTGNDDAGASSTLNSEGSTMKKLTQDERGALVDSLMTNCECQDGEKAAFNALPDATLVRLAENAMPPQFRKGKKKPPEGSEAEEAEETDEEEATENAAGKKKPKVPVANSAGEGAKPPTDNEWQGRMTPEEREDILFARQVRNQQKQTIVNRLTAHITDKDVKKRLVANLSKKPLSELQDELLLHPPVQQRRPVNNADDDEPAANYFGAGGGPVDNAAFKQAEDQDDILPLPTMNWQELSEQNAPKSAKSA